MGIMRLVVKSSWGFAWVEDERSEGDAKAYWRTWRILLRWCNCDWELVDLFNLRYQDNTTRCLFSKHCLTSNLIALKDYIQLSTRI